MMQSKPGAILSFKVNGVKVAWASGFSINEDNPVADIDVLDQLHVGELPHTGHKVSFSVTIFKLDANAAEAVGLRPTNIDDILKQASLSTEVYNRFEDQNEYEMTGVEWTGGTGGSQSRGVWEGTWNFRAVKGGGSL